MPTTPQECPSPLLPRPINRRFSRHEVSCNTGASLDSPANADHGSRDGQSSCHADAETAKISDKVVDLPRCMQTTPIFVSAHHSEKGAPTFFHTYSVFNHAFLYQLPSSLHAPFDSNGDTRIPLHHFLIIIPTRYTLRLALSLCFPVASEKKGKQKTGGFIPGFFLFCSSLLWFYGCKAFRHRWKRTFAFFRLHGGLFSNHFY